MTGLYLPGAKWRPISYRAAAGAFTHPPLGYIVHVPVSDGSLFDYFNGLTAPNRKFCTAWVAKDGSAEQYTTLDMQSWAQAAGNADYWSFEVEGYPNEPMTDAQLATLATWHTFLGVKDAIATAPGQQGIGTHQMGGAAWGGHPCPGPVRAAQLPQILALTQGDTMPTPQDLLNAPLGVNPGDATKPVDVGTSIEIARNYTYYTWQIVRQLAAQSGVAVDEKALAAQLLTSLTPTLTEAVTAAATAGGSPDQIAAAVVAKIGDAITKGA